MRAGRGLVAGALVVAALTPASAADARLQPMGGPRHATQLCGERHVALMRTLGRRVSIGQGRGVLRIDRCEAGRWVRFGRLRLHPRRRRALPSRTLGDFRVRGRRARAYYRVFMPTAAPPPATAGPGAPAPAPAAGVVNVPVTFRVVNQNRSRAACRTDGGEYELRGHLIAPRSTLSAPAGRAVTLYMHGIGWTQDYWHFTAVPGYDYATELAREGHASLVYDQLGYGTSGKPEDPLTVCYGGEADIASQIVAQLRSGAYGGPEFAKVALASHSVMGLASEPEAYSFKDVDALAVTSWADQGFSDKFREISREIEAHCATAGGHYEASAELFKEAYFASAEPAVADAAAALRAPIPCGEPQSAFQTIGADVASLRELTIPVLLVYGIEDALFNQPGAGETQAQLFAGSEDVTLEFVEGSGHALALERTAPAYRALMSRWLSAHGF
jgi:alpha-beta hydrolase superfamily lysophospholipase